MHLPGVQHAIAVRVLTLAEVDRKVETFQLQQLARHQASTVEPAADPAVVAMQQILHHCNTTFRSPV